MLNDALANGRRMKCLTVVDDFIRESVDIAVDHGISGACVARMLDQQRSAGWLGIPPCIPAPEALPDWPDYR